MELDDFLDVHDHASANLAKLDAVWERAAPMIPDSPSHGSSREYEDLRRSWIRLLAGLPPIDGFTVTAELPDADEVADTYIDLFDLDPGATFRYRSELEQPGRQLDEYRFRLGATRREAIRARLERLVETVEHSLATVATGKPANSKESITGSAADKVRAGVDEIERLIGDTVERRGRWADLHRHLHFGQAHDCQDIVTLDWPSVMADIAAALDTPSDPLPIPAVDLGREARAQPTGRATVGFNWNALDAEGFERLVFDIIHGTGGCSNVQWLTKTTAPDRGRDVSFDRRLDIPGGAVRIERVIVQVKFQRSRSFQPMDFHSLLSQVPLWAPPTVHVLVIATCGRFTADAVAVIDKHNDSGAIPVVEMWPDSHIETLLTRRPDLIASYGLRPT